MEPPYVVQETMVPVLFPFAITGFMVGMRGAHIHNLYIFTENGYYWWNLNAQNRNWWMYQPNIGSPLSWNFYQGLLFSDEHTGTVYRADGD